MFKSLAIVVGALALPLAASAAGAVTVQWADLTGQPDATTVVGTVAGIGVTYSGSLGFSQTAGGTDYWTDSGYTQGLVNRPTGSDIIALSGGGAKSISFSAPVTDLYVAFTSWNGNTVTFDRPFEIVSQGCGYWGCGTFVPSGGNTGFFGSGEVHGVLKFAGTFSTLNFTDTSEYWHGLTVGIADSAVPEPASWAMLMTGLGLVGFGMRRRRGAAQQVVA